MATLYGAGLSPFVRKVRVVLAEKKRRLRPRSCRPFQRQRRVQGDQPAREDPGMARRARRALRLVGHLRVPREAASDPGALPERSVRYAHARSGSRSTPTPRSSASPARRSFSRASSARASSTSPPTKPRSRRPSRRSCRRSSTISKASSSGDWLVGRAVLDRRHRRRHAASPTSAAGVSSTRTLAEARALRRPRPRAAVVQGTDRRGSRGARARRLTTRRRAADGDRPRPPGAHVMTTTCRRSGTSASRTTTRRRAGRSTGSASRIGGRAVLPGPHVPVIRWHDRPEAGPGAAHRRCDDRRLDAHHRGARSSPPRSAALSRRRGGSRPARSRSRTSSTRSSARTSAASLFHDICCRTPTLRASTLDGRRAAAHAAALSLGISRSCARSCGYDMGIDDARAEDESRARHGGARPISRRRSSRRGISSATASRLPTSRRPRCSRRWCRPPEYPVSLARRWCRRSRRGALELADQPGVSLGGTTCTAAIAAPRPIVD